MTIVNDYQSGTVSVANGSTAVTGVGTAWQVDANNPVIRPGDLFGRDGLWVPIASVTDNTHLTLAENWPGTTLSGSAYRIRIQPDGSRYTAAARTLVELLADGKLASLAGQAGAADKLPYLTGATTFGLTNLTAKARELLGQVDEAAMRSLLRVAKKQADALDATEGAGLVVGAFGLGGTDGLQGAGADIAALARTQIINALDALPVGWDSALGTYPMGMHWQRSAAVQAQFAVGFNGEAGFRNTDGSGWQAWRKLFHNRNVLGPVSLSSGIPTGAIINRGSNANGEYVRFADGTQLCMQSISVGAVTTAQGALYAGASPTTWIFPAAFIDSPTVAGLDGSSYNVFINAGPSTSNSCDLMPFSWTSIGSSRTARVVAIGRWN